MGGRDSMFHTMACEQAARAHLKLHQNHFEQSEDTPLLPPPRQGTSLREEAMPAQLGGVSVFLGYLALCILHFLIFFVIQTLVLSSISSELSSSNLMID